MIAMKLSTGLTVSAREARIVFQSCLWATLGGDMVKDGWVWTESLNPAVLYSPIYTKLREATEQDHAIWTLLKPTLFQPAPESEAPANQERTAHA